MILKHEGREVEVTLYGDGPDDLFLDSGTYIDDGSEVSEDVLDALMDQNYGIILEDWTSNQIDRAHSMFEDR